MTCYLTKAHESRRVARIPRFEETAAPVTQEPMPSLRGARALVQVTHASIGVTDIMARRGDYLLQPRPGFVPGYDFVGTIAQLPANGGGFVQGQRVAGVLPRMGAHASHLLVPTSILVPVPGSLDALMAATIPLDAVTAAFTLDALDLISGPVLVQGAGGAVGAWAAQLAAARGLDVFGTASSRSRAYAERFTPQVLDHRDPGWIDRLIDGGGVDGAIDHTANSQLRRAVHRGGRIVHIGFGGEPGAQRAATAAGSARAALRRFARPAERVVSTPLLVATQRRRYRQALAGIFDAAASGALIAPRPRAVSFKDYTEALAAAARSTPGEKAVLVMP